MERETSKLDCHEPFGEYFRKLFSMTFCQQLTQICVCYFLQKQNIEIKQLKKLLEDESGKLKNGMKLDMNLERSRVQEVVSIANDMPRIEVMNLEVREVTSAGSGEYSQ